PKLFKLLQTPTPEPPPENVVDSAVSQALACQAAVAGAPRDRNGARTVAAAYQRAADAYGQAFLAMDAYREKLGDTKATFAWNAGITAVLAVGGIMLGAVVAPLGAGAAVAAGGSAAVAKVAAAVTAGTAASALSGGVKAGIQAWQGTHEPTVTRIARETLIGASTGALWGVAGGAVMGYLLPAIPNELMAKLGHTAAEKISSIAMGLIGVPVKGKLAEKARGLPADATVDVDWVGQEVASYVDMNTLIARLEQESQAEEQAQSSTAPTSSGGGGLLAAATSNQNSSPAPATASAPAPATATVRS
ncbi:MAG: hypothetical protein KC561_12340, partial [Myxococcales bacterium]|nr:hypothetical protein [Myxococcales bacterium]